MFDSTIVNIFLLLWHWHYHPWIPVVHQWQKTGAIHMLKLSSSRTCGQLITSVSVVRRLVKLYGALHFPQVKEIASNGMSCYEWMDGWIE